MCRIFLTHCTQCNRHICSDPLLSTQEAQMQFAKEKKKTFAKQDAPTGISTEADLTSDIFCKVTDGKIQSFLWTGAHLCRQSDSSRLPLSPLHFSDNHYRSLVCYKHLAPVITALTQLRHRSITRTHTARPACGRGVFCYFTRPLARPWVSGAVWAQGLERKAPPWGK